MIIVAVIIIITIVIITFVVVIIVICILVLQCHHISLGTSTQNVYSTSGPKGGNHSDAEGSYVEPGPTSVHDRMPQVMHIDTGSDYNVLGPMGDPHPYEILEKDHEDTIAVP